MARIFLCTLLVVAVAAFALSQTTGKLARDNRNIEREIRELIRELDEAHLRGDVAFFEHLYSAEMVNIGADGVMLTLAQLMAEWKSGALKYERYVSDDLRIRSYCQTVVVTGRNTRKGRNKDSEFSGQVRFTRLYVKQQGEWKAVATHTSRIAEQFGNPEVRSHDAGVLIISTVAGNGVEGVGGDGEDATKALLNMPRRLTINRTGVCFILPTRAITASGASF